MWFPSWLQWYKKPEYRDIREYATAVTHGRRSLSPDRGKTTIPSKLKLDRVLANKTCSPMSLYDFYMYLKYIEFSAENLEFYIWFKNYESTWAKAKVGSVETFGEKDNESRLSSSASTDSINKSSDSLPPIEITQFQCDPELARDTVERIAQMISSDAMCSSARKCGPSKACALPPAAVAAMESTWLHLNYPNPRRAELNAVIETFLLPGSEKELNIPPSMRDLALSQLATSDDPAHLQPIADHVYQLLRNCSHRNFVRLGVSNGTVETICVATGLGIVLTCAGFLYILLRALYPGVGAHSRWDVWGAWPMWWLGMSLILSGLRGSCFFLLLFTRRQPLPWERFDDSASVLTQTSGLMKRISRMMIFDRKLRVKDVHLRRLQHKIVMQSLLGGSIFATCGILFFIFLPVWSQTVPQL